MLFKAIPGFEHDQNISFYLAVAYLAINDCKNAEQILLLMLNKNQAINNQVQWYLGLSYLQENEINKAVKHFQNLSIAESNYTQNAIKILKKIK